MNKIIVIGSPGAGKSTFSRTLAVKTGLPLRFEHCEQVFFFDMPVEVCLEGAAARVDTVRDDLPWVETEFDADFRQYIIDFQKDQLPVIYRIIDQYKNSRRIVVFRSWEEADAYLEKGV